MKYSKFLLLLAVSALTISCAKEKIAKSAQESITQITATYAENDTKTVLGSDETSILWSPNDEISVFYNGDGVRFTSINSTPKDRTIFISSYSLIYGGTETSTEPYIYGAYPYSSSNAQEGELITLTVPSSQIAVEGSFGRGAYPSVGRSKTTDIAFYNVCGGIRFSVTQTGISDVKITGNNDEFLAGRVKVTFDSDNRPVVTEVISGEKSVTLHSTREDGFMVGEWYFIALLPTKLENGISIELTKTDKKAGTKNISSSLEVKRSVFGSIQNIDQDVVFKQGIKEIKLNQDVLFLKSMTASKLTYTIEPSDAEYQWIKWKSNNEEVATVTNGVVTAVGNGFCDITIESDNGACVDCFVLVRDNSIIIKEAYIGGSSDGSSSHDSYITLYNNSSTDVDASNIVFAIAAPYNSNATNPYYIDGHLIYEDLDWIPAVSAIWHFTSSVTIPAFSQIVVACFGAIDHTMTYAESVDLSKAEYYWMSNIDVEQFTNSKYQASPNIPTSHYLTCYPFSPGNAWTLSISSPAIFIGEMSASEVERISKDSKNYDHTMGGTTNVVKFPKANVVDAVEIWTSQQTYSNQYRFPTAISAYPTPLWYGVGYSSYRNVHYYATKKLSENKDKLVMDYNLDPSRIDAEASINNGAHIVYLETNNSEYDFHMRSSASLK